MTHPQLKESVQINKTKKLQNFEAFYCDINLYDIINVEMKGKFCHDYEFLSFTDFVQLESFFCTFSNQNFTFCSEVIVEFESKSRT